MLMRSSVSRRDLTVRDLLAIANVHCSAFPDRVLTKLGIEAVRRFYEWLLVGPHDVIPVGAFLGDTLVGFCFGGVFRGAWGGFLAMHRLFLVCRVLTRPWLVLNPIFRAEMRISIRVLFRNSPQKRRITTLGQDSSKGLASKPFSILSIAVLPQYQNMGIGKMLMNHSELVARQRGFRKMRLTVHPEDQAAIGFYQSLGWEKVQQGGNRQGSMEKSLESGH
jgi:ribosomal protein S18 acetylase RimI-like enzyme